MAFPGDRLRTDCKNIRKTYRLGIITKRLICELLRILQIAQLATSAFTGLLDYNDIACAYVAMCPASEVEQNQGLLMSASTADQRTGTLTDECIMYCCE